MVKRTKRDDKAAFAFFDDQKSGFVWLTKQAQQISHRVGGHIANPSQGYATWLFIRACVTAGSLTQLFEGQQANDNAILYLDHPSIAALGRALMENIAVLIYFTDPKLTEEEWRCRRDIVVCAENLNADVAVMKSAQDGA